MPTVPYSPVPGVAPSTSAPGAPGSYFTQRASPDDFGAQVGQAVGKLGQTVGQASSEADATALQYQVRENNIATDDAFTQYQDKTQDILYGAKDGSRPGYYSLHGQAAVAARPAVLQALDDAREGIKASLPNQMTQLGFDTASRRLNMTSVAGIGSHYDQEWNRSAIATQTAAIDIAARAVANGYNDDALFQDNLQRVLRAADAKSALSEGALRGTPEGDAIFTNNRMQASQTLYTARAVAMGTANPAAGEAFVKAHSDQFDAITLRRLTDEFKGKADTAGDNSYVSGLLSGASGGAGAPAGVADAIHGQEHSKPGSVSVNGARGDWQIEPATFRQYARPGEDIDKPGDNEAVGRRIIDDLSRRPNINGDPARIAVGYFSGPGNVAPAGSPTPWLVDKKDGNGTSTSTYVAGVLARMGSSAPATQATGAPGTTTPRAAAVGGTGSYPDESALIQQLIRDNPDPDRQAARLSKLTQALGTLRLATETDRRDLTNSLGDLQAAALGGQDVVIPTDRINHLLAPAQAADELEKLNVAVRAGQVFKGVRFGTPEQINAAYQDLSTGLGPISTMIRRKGAPQVPGGTAEPGSDQETPEAYRLRMQILNKFDETVKNRTAALVDDPAGYAQREPGVAAAAAALKAAPNDPELLSKYNNATLAVQTSLGVPAGQQHILTKAAAQAQAKQLMTVDPSKGDMGQALAGVAQQYGDAWPKAFGDLVTLGKLPGNYQILASMPDPVARTDFQRALAATSAKGGVAQLREDVPPTAAKDIDTGLDDKLTDFRRSASIPGLSSNIALISTVRDSIKTLAYYYAVQGGDGPSALDKAADAVINSKYDFDGGTMRVPKGMLPAAETVTANLQAGLKPSDLAPLAADTQATEKGPGMTVDQRQAVTLRAAQRGQWVPNENDTGLVLVGKLANGAMVQMKRADGSRIEVPFKGMTEAASAQTPPATIDAAPSLQ